MAINTKAVKARISSVRNTKKITRAMQMIAAVKMRKAVESAVSTRTYALLARQLMDNVSTAGIEHPLAEQREVKKVLLIVITSNKGLCGNYNSSVQKEFNKLIDSDKSVTYEVIALGKKAASYAKKRGINILEIYEKIGDNREFSDILPVSKSVIDKFINKEFDDVKIIYTNYISGLSQEVGVRKLLPFSMQSIDNLISEINEHVGDKEEETEISDYEFEPDAESVLSFLLPMLVEIQIYQSILESSASEHSSRMIAMKNATEAAGDMIQDLVLEFNKGRQASITKEIAEITGGSEALAA